MANWDITTTGTWLEFEATLGQYETAITIDTNHFLTCFQGSANDGFAQIFTVNTTTWAITTAASSLEFDTQNYSWSSMAKIDTNHAIIAWRGSSGGTGYLQVLTVNTTTWAVTTAGSALNIDTVGFVRSSVVMIDTNHCLVAWGEDITELNGKTQVCTIDTTTWAVTTANAFLLYSATNITAQALYNTLIKIDDTHFINATSDIENDDDGYIQVLAVNTTTWAVTTASSYFDYDTGQSVWSKTILIDANHFLVVWRDSGAVFQAQIMQVNTTTWAVSTSGAKFQVDAASGSSHFLVIDTNHVVFTYSGSGADGYMSVLEINTTTWAVTTASTIIEYDTTNGAYPAVLRVDTTHFINFYSGEGSDGYAGIFNIEVPAVAPSTNIKSFNGLAYASVKSVNGLAIASVKNKDGLA